jgi:hypothetical protein
VKLTLVTYHHVPTAGYDRFEYSAAREPGDNWPLIDPDGAGLDPVAAEFALVRYPADGGRLVWERGARVTGSDERMVRVADDGDTPVWLVEALVAAQRDARAQPVPGGPPSPEVVVAAIRECVAVVRPGQVLVVRLPWDTTPDAHAHYVERLSSACMDTGVRAMVILADELAVAQPAWEFPGEPVATRRAPVELAEPIPVGMPAHDPEVGKVLRAAYRAASPITAASSWWVMSRAWYERVAAWSGYTAGQPHEGDLLMGLPVQVTDTDLTDDGEPRIIVPTPPPVP